MRMRALIIGVSLLLACQSAPIPVFDGGKCGQPLSDGGIREGDPREMSCQSPGDTCRLFVYDDPCTTSCACGSDAGWSCSRQCPPYEPCRPQGYCMSNYGSIVCQTDDAGCSLVCHCLYGYVSRCSTECP